MAVGEDLRTAWHRLRGWYPVQLGEQRFRCDPEHIDFWRKVDQGLWEPRTFAVFDQLLSAGATCLDVGAWIGPTVLFAARRCRRVYCLEPDRVAYRYLLQNIQLNGLENVLPFNFALAAEGGLNRMASPRGKQGDSMTSLLLPDGIRGMAVLCLAWQSWLELVGVPVFDFIKMDIEGGEFSLLPTMTDYLDLYRPRLYLSLHPHLLPDSERGPNMAKIAASLKMYGGCYDRNGEKIRLESLREGQALHRAGTYLLLPE